MQTRPEIEKATDRLIAQAALLPAKKAARLLAERAERAHATIWTHKGDAFALAEARDRLRAEADRLLRLSRPPILV